MTKALPQVFVIGSSTTVLFGPHLQQMIEGVFDYARKGNEPAELAAAFDDLDVPRGASAGDSSMVLDYLHTLGRTDAFRPDIVLMHVGLHDLKHAPGTTENQVPLAQYRDNVAAIVAWFGKRNIRLLWLRSGPLDEALHNARCPSFHRIERDLEDYNDAAEAILARQGVPVLDLAGFTRRLGPMAETLKDHVHFRDDIVRLQAAFIAGALMGLSPSI